MLDHKYLVPVVYATVASAILVSNAKDDMGNWLCSKVEALAAQKPDHNVIGFREGLVQYEIASPYKFDVRKISFPDGCQKAYTFSRTVGQ